MPAEEVRRVNKFIGYLIGITCLVISFSSPAIAQETGDEYEEDYDFSWLDPDKKIYVIQNRKYRKGQKIELAASFGLNLSGPYTSSYVIMPRISYYFSERWGASALLGFQSNADSGTLIELKDTTTVIPNIRDITSLFGGSVSWIPFYGKINLFNKIFYFDTHLELGVASISSDVNLNFSSTGADSFLSTTHTGFFWGTGTKLFLSQTFAIRVDLLAIYYSAPIVRRGVASTDTETHDNYYLTFGLSARF